MTSMSRTDRAPQMQPQEIEAHLAARKAEAPRIDAGSCVVEVCRAGALDPYGVLGIDEDGAQWFAQTPSDGLWVWSGDLPEETREAIKERQKREPFFWPLRRLSALRSGRPVRH
jgi:hypothetical protein